MTVMVMLRDLLSLKLVISTALTASATLDLVDLIRSITLGIAEGQGSRFSMTLLYRYTKLASELKSLSFILT